MSFIDKILGGGAIKVAEGVANIVDKFVQTKEEKAELAAKIQAEVNRHMEAIAADATRQLELELKDKDSARTRETDFVKSTGHIDWMMTAVGILVLLTFIGTLVMIGFRKLPEGSEHLMINAIGIIEGLVLSVVTYYFGSSAGSRIKDMRK
jgi:hypothetical protein